MYNLKYHPSGQNEMLSKRIGQIEVKAVPTAAPVSEIEVKAVPTAAPVSGPGS